MEPVNTKSNPESNSDMDTVELVQEQWDYLIVLDACRYDYFEKVWRKYLNGNLQKRVSPGSSTPDWRDKAFPAIYPDIIYISCNPFINSFVKADGYSASKHFYKVYDLWRQCWDERKDTVLPQSVTHKAIEIINANPDKRAVVHYLQPHEPFLAADVADLSYDRGESLFDKMLHKGEQAAPKTTFPVKIVGLLTTVWRRTGLLGRLPLWRVRKFLRLPPMSHMDAVRRKFGKKGVRKAYSDNLEIVLKCVAELVMNLSGKVIVTADHGELLGEGGRYGHPMRSSDPILLEVPWLVIDKGERIFEAKGQTATEEQQRQQCHGGDRKADKEAQKEIKEKLRALGYFE